MQNYAHEVVTEVMHSRVPPLELAQQARDQVERLAEQRDELRTMLQSMMDEYLMRDPTTGHIAALTLEQAKAAIAKARE